MKTSLLIFLVSLTLMACTSRTETVDSEASVPERPDEGSTPEQLLEEEAPSFITE